MGHPVSSVVFDAATFAGAADTATSASANDERRSAIVSKQSVSGLLLERSKRTVEAYRAS